MGLYYVSVFLLFSYVILYSFRSQNRKVRARVYIITVEHKIGFLWL